MKPNGDEEKAEHFMSRAKGRGFESQSPKKKTVNKFTEKRIINLLF